MFDQTNKNPIVHGNSANKNVKNYILITDSGMLKAKRSCYIVFPECRSDAIGFYKKIYRKRIFFAGPASIIPVDNGVYRMIHDVEIFESPEFSITHKLFADAIEIFLENRPQTETDCCICLDAICDEMCISSCGHMFHDQCINAWKDICNSCPLCRKPIDIYNHS